MDVRILIVDDLPFMRTVLRNTVQEAGFTVVGEAADGKTGIMRYIHDHPDVVLLDIAMPVMDGITALKKILRYDASALVIMCSALDEEELIVKAIRMGAKDFVVKPFRPERIISAVRKAVESARKQFVS